MSKKQRTYLAGIPPKGEPWRVTQACERVMEGIIAFRNGIGKE